MLDSNTPAKFISFLYENYLVRFHIHSVNGTLWVVGKDIYVISYTLLTLVM